MPVAQLDRAMASDAMCRAFESHRAYQKNRRGCAGGTSPLFFWWNQSYDSFLVMTSVSELAADDMSAVWIASGIPEKSTCIKQVLFSTKFAALRQVKSAVKCAFGAWNIRFANVKGKFHFTKKRQLFYFTHGFHIERQRDISLFTFPLYRRFLESNM